tara:strand:- start:84361 stop:84795 length:435 start_codon:yes stop_codon:yes gene_type:complete
MTATAYNDSMPSLQEEIDRKSLDTLGDLVLKHRDNAISTAQFEIGINTLFSIVSGLVAGDFIDLVTRASQEETIGGNLTDYITRILIHPERGFVAAKYGYGKLSFTTITETGKKMKTFDTTGQAFRAFLKLCKFLNDKGYEDIT